MPGRWVVVGFALLGLAACTSEGDTDSGPGRPTDEAIASAAVPTPGATSPGSGVPPAPNVGTPSTRDDEVSTAVDLLTGEMGYSSADVRVVRVEDVTWPSRALGCPAWEEGQGAEPVPGYRIILGHEDVELHYHGADGADPRRCEFLDF